MQTKHARAITEAVLKGILQEIGPDDFAIALNNISCHGEVFQKNFSELLDDDGTFLREWYKGISVLYESTK